MKRPHWDEYWMKMAHLIRERSTCRTRLVGCVIVDDRNRIVATGYNGAPYKEPQCDEVGCSRVMLDGRSTCNRCVHAEANAIVQAAAKGTSTQDCFLYTTLEPCYECLKLIGNSGITHVFYHSAYEGLTATDSQLIGSIRYVTQVT